jgi:hypothetical protein
MPLSNARLGFSGSPKAEFGAERELLDRAIPLARWNATTALESARGLGAVQDAHAKIDAVDDSRICFGF